MTPADLAADLIARYGLTPDDLVVEVGSGVGLFLRELRARGPRALGVEPDVWAMSEAFAGRIDTIGAYFGPGTAGYVLRRYGPAKLVLLRDARALLRDRAKFAADAGGCLAPGGVAAELRAGDNGLTVAEVFRRPADIPERRAA